MKTILYLSLTLACLYLTPACMNERSESVKEAKELNEAKKIDDGDSRFMVEAAHDGMIEVEISKYAENKASADEVKKFAKQMIDDHSKRNAEIQTLAAKKGISLPADVTRDAQDITEDWDDKAGNDFDRAYMRRIVRNHRNAVDDFDKASRNASDEEIRGFASNALPVLRSHVEMAEKIKKEVDDKKKINAAL